MKLTEVNIMTVVVRQMQAVDVNAVYAIEKEVQFHPWSLTQFQDAQQNYHSMVIDVDGEVRGFCILQPVLDEANLLLMAISPKYQGQGLGYQLLEQSINTLKNAPIQIFLEVRERNLAAIALYEKMAFHQIDMRKNYYPNQDGTREHAVIMVKACSDDFQSLFR